MQKPESYQSATSATATSLLYNLWLVVFLCLLTAAPFSTQAQSAAYSQGSIELEPGGKLWIEGSASVTEYTCKAEELSGNGIIENTRHPRQNVQGGGSVSVDVSIPVHSLECGKKKMNNDMYQALKASNFPFINYRLLEAVRIDSSRDNHPEWMNIRTHGILEIAGVQDTAQVTVQGKLISPHRFRVKGAKQLDMHAFDITPPTALFGLIKTRPELTVHFDVTVRLRSDQ